MKRANLYVGLFVAVLLAVGIIGFSRVNKANAKIADGMDNYTIAETWELPVELNEISGMVWVGNNTLACIQDEDGKLFIYDLTDKAISEEIPFAGKGDYEGIALYKDDMYVMQSDGLLFEIKNWNTTNKIVSTHKTGFQDANNMESLAYSALDSSLLTIPKDRDSKDDFKGIYTIPLSSKKADTNTPAYKIEMNAKALKIYRDKKLYKTFNPSEIAVHPITNDIYVVEGQHPKLLILDANGTLKTVYKLDEINFPQPEGMTFSEEGDLYISNEAVNGTASIHLVELKVTKS
ncbi:SdiA-regulated protein [Gelidibacter algens]|uniref:SdiA-regulated protein n=1 Tax=Gelidibacter algens TaxID=49280 RepID=A0A1A7R2G5_9FLAO|nr:SdiA-regulated domain-containing protein [Gelidibacter algens]OBX26455.1 hypothetical protein A9996_03890 [Gelidibacter algens]RAJ26738.1 SdiA-regulated protein [Gelidibacter algens]